MPDHPAPTLSDGSPVPPPPSYTRPAWLRPPADPARVSDALALLEAGWTTQAAADRVHLHWATVHRYARARGMTDTSRRVRAHTRTGHGSQSAPPVESAAEQRASLSRLITLQYVKVKELTDVNDAASAIAALARAAASLHGWGSSGKGAPSDDRADRRAAKRLTEDS